MPSNERDSVDANTEIQYLGDPYAREAAIEVSGEDLQQISPQMGSTERQKLVEAANENSFKILSGELNERAILDRMYNQVATRISAELGPFVYDQFAKAQPVVYAATLHLLKEKRDGGGNIQSHSDANTSSDFVIEPLLPQSFGGSETDYTFGTGTTGEFNLAPGFGGAADNSTYTASAEEQSMVIFGAELSTNPKVLQSVAVGQDDGNGGRLPEIIGKQMSGGTQQAVETANVYWVEDGSDVKVTGLATADASVEWPLLGVNIVNYDNAIRHSQLEGAF